MEEKCRSFFHPKVMKQKSSKPSMPKTRTPLKCKKVAGSQYSIILKNTLNQKIKFMNQPLTPCLWFDSEAEDAAKFYTSIFKNSRINNTSRYGKEGFEIHKRP